MLPHSSTGIWFSSCPLAAAVDLAVGLRVGAEVVGGRRGTSSRPRRRSPGAGRRMPLASVGVEQQEHAGARVDHVDRRDAAVGEVLLGERTAAGRWRRRRACGRRRTGGRPGRAGGRSLAADARGVGPQLGVEGGGAGKRLVPRREGLGQHGHGVGVAAAPPPRPQPLAEILDRPFVVVGDEERLLGPPIAGDVEPEHDRGDRVRATVAGGSAGVGRPVSGRKSPPSILLRWRLQRFRYHLRWQERSTLLDKIAIAALVVTAMMLILGWPDRRPARGAPACECGRLFPFTGIAGASSDFREGGRQPSAPRNMQFGGLFHARRRIRADRDLMNAGSGWLLRRDWGLRLYGRSTLRTRFLDGPGLSAAAILKSNPCGQALATITHQGPSR